MAFDSHSLTKEQIMNCKLTVRWSAALAFALCTPALTAYAKTVTLSMDVQLDQVAPEDAKMYRVGGHDLDRITYDDSTVDPKTHRVRITSLSHYIAGHWHPTDPADASILDLSAKPYRLNFVSSVNHGRLIVALFEADTQRMAMLARPDFHMLIAGSYKIDPTPLTAAQIAAPPPGFDSPDTMPILSGMPGGTKAAAGAGAAAKLSTSSTYGELLDNPKTKAVLVELIPEVVNNPQSQMGRSLPLKGLSQFEPTLTAEKLAQIDARFAQVP
jgi:hypothetical protein